MILQTQTSVTLALIRQNTKTTGPHPTADLFEPLPGQAIQFDISDRDTCPAQPINDRT